MLSLVERKAEYGLNNDIRVEPSEGLSPAGLVHRDAILALHKRHGSERISCKAFSPTQMPPRAIPFLAMLSVEWADDQNSYRYRVFGSEMRAVTGVDLSGKTVLDFPKRTCRTFLMRLFDECAHQARPVFSSAEIEYAGDLKILTDKTFIPLFDETLETVAKILTLFTFEFRYADENNTSVDAGVEPDQAYEHFRVFADLGQMAAAVHSDAPKQVVGT